MKKREKIILAVMSACILFFAVYYVFLSAPSAPTVAVTGGKSEDSAKMMTEISNSLKKDETVEPDSYVIARAESNWEIDPFYKGVLASAKDKPAGGGKGPDIIYSGYVDLGVKRVAVINGNPYEIGDKLELTGAYYLKQIDSTRVIVVDREQSRNITIPLQQETF
ncbi:MAG: hypothetical protein NTV99_02400 [Deltaproteobacteria bacterium]|nr:hypothetical protein [Deltaproteobacteria bacterium]